MILVGNQRGGASNLASHLMKAENEQIEVHELRGFSGESLDEAFNEAYAVSRGTKCKQFLFSLSLNPPREERVETPVFEDAINRAEERLGLSGQPRAIVFHEKQGRRHAHAVWSRIDAENMKAVHLPFTKNKLNELAREIWIENGWKNIPRGFVEKSERDPKNFSLAEWQQAKRAGRDPREIKTAFQDAWAISDSKAAFSNALNERGFWLAKGDRRGHVAIDHTGEPYAVSRFAGVKAKEVRERLGEPEELPSIDETKESMARQMLATMHRHKRTLDDEHEERRAAFKQERLELIAKQQEERDLLFKQIEERQTAEAVQRQDRFRSGLSGVLDHITGRHKEIAQDNQREAYDAMVRDRQEKDALIFAQLEHRREFEDRRIEMREQETQAKHEVKQDIQGYEQLAMDAREQRRQAFLEKRQEQAAAAPVRAPTPQHNHSGPAPAQDAPQRSR